MLMPRGSLRIRTGPHRSQLLLLMHVIASLVRLNVYGVFYLVLLGILMMIPRQHIGRGAGPSELVRAHPPWH